MRIRKESMQVATLVKLVKLIMEGEKIYDPQLLFHRIYYHPSVHNDYRTVRDAIQIAKAH